MCALNNYTIMGIRKYPTRSRSNVLSRVDPGKIIELQIFEDFKRRERIERFESEAFHHKVARIRDRIVATGRVWSGCEGRVHSPVT